MGSNPIKEIKKWPKFQQNIATWAFIIIFAVIGLQIVSFLFVEQVTLATIKVGPAIIIILMGALIVLPFAILKRLVDGQGLNQKDIVAIILLTALVLVLMIKIRVLVPEIFMQAINQLQSMLGII